MTVRLLPSASFRQMPWKNGGGVTTEIAIAPEGATLETFDWRVSMADVVADGPFSCFPTVDRTLSVLEGEGINLVFGGGQSIPLAQDSEPLPFAADVPVVGHLMSGPIRDLNVMSRRGRVDHRVTRQVVAGRGSLPVRGTVLLLFAHSAAVDVSCRGGVHPLTSGDALLASGWQDQDVVLSGNATVFAVEFWPAVPRG